MRIIIDTSEVHQLTADLSAAGPYVAERAPLVVEKVGHDMLASAQVNTPVDTGFLKSSETIDFTDGGLGFDLGPTADYGEYVELGTSEMNPEPYLGPAFDQHLPNLESALGRLGEQGVTRG